MRAPVASIISMNHWLFVLSSTIENNNRPRFAKLEIAKDRSEAFLGIQLEAPLVHRTPNFVLVAATSFPFNDITSFRNEAIGVVAIKVYRGIKISRKAPRPETESCLLVTNACGD